VDAGQHALGDQADCVAYAPLGAELSLPAARDELAWKELRRHLRMLDVVQPGFTLRTTASATAQPDVEAGRVCFQTLHEAGRILFEHPFVPSEGYGNGVQPSGRAGPYRRVQAGRFGGPDALSCTSCHWRGGVGGAGALVDNTYLGGDGDRPFSADARNPPALMGVGAAQLVASEMTADLQAVRDGALERARASGGPVTAELLAKGTSFGTLTALADGTVDARGVVGVDADLVVKPFGWKGTARDLRGFVAVSLQVHLGMQSEDLLTAHGTDTGLVGTGANPADPDGDGITHEVTSGQMTALVTYLATLETPVVRPHDALDLTAPPAPGIAPPTRYVYQDEWARGRALFDSVGCASCHTPVMVLRSPVFALEIPSTGNTVNIDLSAVGEEPRLAYDPVLGGYGVWAFSDFKRHDMGEAAAALHDQDGVAPTQYLTRRLWGLAQSSPYYYDGRATTLDAAVEAHGGEAAFARDAYATLGPLERGALRVFLVSLRRQRRVNVP
jgi:mono/diheme cytochrome c family protein